MNSIRIDRDISIKHSGGVTRELVLDLQSYMDAKSHLKQKVNQLSPLSEDEWLDFSSRWKSLSVKKGDYIIRVGQVEKYFYFVHSGVLRAFLINDGIDISVGFTYDGDFSGAYDSFLQQQPADWSMQATTDSELLRIGYDDLMLMFDRYKSVERWGRVFNAQALIGIARRQVEVRSFSAEQRFERLFQQSPHIFQLVSQKHLASYVGMAPETFSRMRKQRMERKN